MDPTATIEPSNPQSNGADENNDPSSSQSNANKRPLVDDGDDEEGGVTKRRKIDGELKRVAEIVLVLSAMGSIRGGGKKPSDAEVELMAEARRKLGGICENFAPKDVVDRDAVGKLIEDLGLKKDQNKLGFCVQKLSISERMEVSKRKMEESKKFTHKTTYTSQLLQSNVGASAVENRGVTGSRFPVISSSGFHNSHLGRPSSVLPRVEGAQFKVEGGTTGGTIYSSQVRASSSANPVLANGPPWSIQPPSVPSTISGSENRATSFNPVKVSATNGADVFNMSSQAARDQTIRPFVAQNSPGRLPNIHPTLPGMNLSQAPSPHNYHTEIARTVHKILHPNIPECPSWTPPSRDYMNKALTCQICRVTTNEVSSLLVCDSCEKGSHIKCIQLANPREVPRGDWHCQKCLVASNGKPLPPKYGRVARSTISPKVSSITAGAQVSQERKVAGLGPKVAQQRIFANGNPAIIQNPNMNSAAGRKHIDSASDSKVSTAGGVQLSNISDKSGEPCSPSLGSSIVRSTHGNQNLPSSTNEKISHSESMAVTPGNLLPPPSSEHQNVNQSQIENCAEETSERSPGSNLTNKRRKDCSASENIVSSKRVDVRQDDEGIEQVANTARSGPSDHSGLISDGLQAVEWIGNMSQAMDGKQYYQSCRINGVIYKVYDYALFHFSPDKLSPCKLQAMWDDNKTGSKWLVVRKCYFPGDLPDLVGRPYTSGSNEVFESNKDSIVTPSLLQGPCEVLSAARFEEEIERRKQLGTNGNPRLKSIFLCKWFYDEVKGTFQPSSH